MIRNCPFFSLSLFIYLFIFSLRETMVPNVGTYLLGRHALFLSTAYSYIFIVRASEQGYRP
ncbi:hypothetical protein F4774DRAFT_368428 [Daldinia eschscholtzii]|nr:hypothetical protein F4774DRAFT_368428 [Daldinia eschscholtzii]